jgi:hypothetical protein
MPGRSRGRERLAHCTIENRNRIKVNFEQTPFANELMLDSVEALAQSGQAPIQF